MNYRIILLTLLIPFALNFKTIAQCNCKVKKHTLHFDAAIANTLHYNKPISLTFCEEGCFPEKQVAGISSNFYIGYYRNLNMNNAIKLGFGLSQYNFKEEGLASPGDASLYPYEKEVGYSFYNLDMGYRFTYYLKEQFATFIENDLVFDMLINKSDVLKRINPAYKTKLGIKFNVFRNIDFNLSGFFKTSIVQYNKIDLSDDYLPYAYGVETGISVTFDSFNKIVTDKYGY